jgi:hypothetical protein
MRFVIRLTGSQPVRGASTKRNRQMLDNMAAADADGLLPDGQAGQNHPAAQACPLSTTNPAGTTQSAAEDRRAALIEKNRRLFDQMRSRS